MLETSGKMLLAKYKFMTDIKNEDSVLFHTSYRIPPDNATHVQFNALEVEPTPLLHDFLKNSAVEIDEQNVLAFRFNILGKIEKRIWFGVSEPMEITIQTKKGMAKTQALSQIGSLAYELVLQVEEMVLTGYCTEGQYVKIPSVAIKID